VRKSPGYYNGDDIVAETWAEASDLVLADPSLVLKRIDIRGWPGISADYGNVLFTMGFDGSAQRGLLLEYIRHSGAFSPDDIARAETASKTEWPWV